MCAVKFSFSDEMNILRAAQCARGAGGWFGFAVGCLVVEFRAVWPPNRPRNRAKRLLSLKSPFWTSMETSCVHDEQFFENVFGKP